MNKGLSKRLFKKQCVKQSVIAFVEFVFSSILNVCFHTAVFGCNGLGEFLDLILVGFLIGALVEIVVAFIKKGAKIMDNKFGNRQKPKANNKMHDKAKVGIAWVN